MNDQNKYRRLNDELMTEKSTPSPLKPTEFAPFTPPARSEEQLTIAAAIAYMQYGRFANIEYDNPPPPAWPWCREEWHPSKNDIQKLLTLAHLKGGDAPCPEQPNGKSSDARTVATSKENTAQHADDESLPKSGSNAEPESNPPVSAPAPRETPRCECTIYYGGLAYEPNPDCPIHGKKPLTDKELLERFEAELDSTRQQLRDSQAELGISVSEQTRLSRESDALRAELAGLRADRERLTELVKKMEWPQCNAYGVPQCQFCKRIKPLGHELTCPLSALAGGSAEVQP